MQPFRLSTDMEAAKQLFRPFAAYFPVSAHGVRSKRDGQKGIEGRLVPTNCKCKVFFRNYENAVGTKVGTFCYASVRRNDLSY